MICTERHDENPIKSCWGLWNGTSTEGKKAEGAR